MGQNWVGKGPGKKDSDILHSCRCFLFSGFFGTQFGPSQALGPPWVGGGGTNQRNLTAFGTTLIIISLIRGVFPCLINRLIVRCCRLIKSFALGD